MGGGEGRGDRGGVGRVRAGDPDAPRRPVPDEQGHEGPGGGVAVGGAGEDGAEQVDRGVVERRARRRQQRGRRGAGPGRVGAAAGRAELGDDRRASGHEGHRLGGGAGPRPVGGRCGRRGRRAAPAAARRAVADPGFADADVAAGSGTSTRTVVPAPGADSTSTRPDTADSRVARLRIPRPGPLPGVGVKPGPSSRTTARSTPSASRSRTEIGAPAGVLAGVVDRLERAEVHGRLDGLVVAPDPLAVDDDRRLGLGEVRPQRLHRAEAAQRRRRDPARGLGEHGLGGVELLEQQRETLAGPVEAPRRREVLDEAEGQAQRDEVVLGAVVQVALDPAALAVHLRHQPPPRRRDLLGVGDGGAQLALQLDLEAVRGEHPAEPVGDVGHQPPALVAPGEGLGVDREGADLLPLVPDGERRVGLPHPAAGGAPARGPVAHALAEGGEPDRAGAERAADGLGDQVEAGRVGRGAAGQFGDLGEHPGRRRAGAVEQALGEPLGGAWTGAHSAATTTAATDPAGHRATR